MADWNYKTFWDDSLSQLKKELGDEEYGIWFSKLDYIKAEETVIFASASSSFFLEMFNPKYLPRLEGKIRELTGKNLTIVMEAQKRGKEAGGNSTPKAQAGKKSAGEGGNPRSAADGGRNSTPAEAGKKSEPPPAPGGVHLRDLRGRRGQQLRF